MRTTFRVTILVSLIWMALVVPAQAAGWEMLGERTVNYSTDRDTIRVTGAEGVFRKIKLKVLHSGIELIDLKVHFADGSTHDVAVRSFIKAGGETRVIDLPGAVRVIKKVTFVYRTKGRRPGRGVVRLFGFRAGDDPTPDQPAAADNPVADQPGASAVPTKWVMLGERTVAFGADRDVIAVTASEGTFTRIKLKVKRRGIKILDLKIHYGNGDTHDVSVSRLIAAGGETRVIDLPGDLRVIQKVTMIYRPAARRRGAAKLGPSVVQLWGKK